MNVKELYEHITKHLSAEDALLILLEWSVIQYDKLKNTCMITTNVVSLLHQ